MGFVFGVVKFVVGAGVGAAVGATVTTYILTRDGGETLAKLQGVYQNMLQGAKEGYETEERRQEARRQQLITEVGAQRRLKQIEGKKDKDK